MTQILLASTSLGLALNSGYHKPALWPIFLCSALAAGYILSGLFLPDAAINTWQITLLDLGFLKTGLSLRIALTTVSLLAVLGIALARAASTGTGAQTR